jgi:methyl-accepting chemotaxis protein
MVAAAEGIADLRSERDAPGVAFSQSIGTISAATGEIASVAEETAATAHELAATAQGLNQTASELDRLVRRFTLAAD